MIIEKILDLATNEETIVEREATKDELAYAKKIQAEKAKEAAEVQAKQNERLALFTKLGMTEDEAKLLLG